MKNKTKNNYVYWRDNSIYLNITNRCTNDCIFCVRNYKNGVFGFNLRLEKEPTKDDLIYNLSSLNLKNHSEIVFTGFGEPLLRLDLVIEVIKEMKRNFPDIKTRIDTNGLAGIYFPNRNVVNELKEAGLDSISISLNAENAEVYNKICKPSTGENSYNSLLDFIDKCKEHFDTKITIVDIPFIDVNKCSKLVTDLNLPLKIRQYTGPELS